MDDKPSGYRRPPGIGDFRRPQEDKTPETKMNVRASGFIMLTAFLLMALFNSADLRSSARDLPGNWFTDRLVMGADQWHELMLALGPAHIRPAVHDLFESFYEMRW